MIHRAAHCLVLLPALMWAMLPSAARAIGFPGRSPGLATAIVDAGQLKLENDAVSMSWQLSDGRLRPGPIVNRLSGKTIPGGAELFAVVLPNGQTIRASEMKLLGSPCCGDLPAKPEALRIADRCAGKEIGANLVTGDGTLAVGWRAVLREGANYVRQELTLQAVGRDMPLAQIVTVELPAEGAKTVGTVRGSPVVAGDLFFACENPLANNQGQDGRVRCALPWNLPLKVGDAHRVASVVGVAPPSQMRRAFLCYVERERPRPYQPFLHYNSWYDIRKLNQRNCVEVIDLLGRELTEKRGVRLASFVFDDGWDDPKTLWGFHSGFPSGFTPLVDATAKYHSAVGVWLSPFGGYGDPREQRLKYGRAQGFEIDNNGFALAGPKYNARFQSACSRMIKDYGVNYFKFDGIGAGLEYEKLSAAGLADMVAMVRLCELLRRQRPDLYISFTTGSWPSPYWLWYADSIWRNGNDADFCGQGSHRQRWMNYRDAITQQMVVRRGPLYPLNSLMNQGIMHAQLGIAAQLENDLQGIIDDFRMFFGSGTQLQELYITPQKLTPEMWDALAEAAAWSRDNADVLVDTHWIGGDAGKGQPYGYASWSPRKGILCIRNPGKQPKVLSLKLADALELPQDAPRRYTLKSPWKADAHVPSRTIAADTECRIELKPFEVCILEASPSAEGGSQ
jgi:hypothetical protein